MSAEGCELEIHHPKAFHGWREFAKEVGIIVLGVLLALGAEQIVASLHEARLRGEARAAVRKELADNLASLSRRNLSETCIKKRLDEMGQAIDRAGSAKGYVAPRWVGRPSIWQIDNQLWQAQAGSGRAGLLEPGELRSYSLIYTALETAVQEQVREQVAWSHLRALEEVGQPSDSLVTAARLALGEARYEDWRIGLSLAQSRQAAAAIGVDARTGTPPTSARYKAPSTCVPMQTSRSEALKQIHNEYGEP